MDIYINDQKIDFKLENEKYLGDVVEGLLSWTRQGGFQIQKLTFDDKPYSAGDGAKDGTPIESVGRIDIEAKSRLEIHQENLQLLYQYFSLLLKSIEGSNISLLRELKVEAAPIIKLLAEFLEEDPESQNSISFGLKSEMEKIDPDNMAPESEGYKNIISQLSALKLILNERISEIGNPLGELSKTLKALRLSHQEMNDISVLLQTGKDREALGSIIKFSELSQKALRLYPLLESNGYTDLESLNIDDKNIFEYYGDLNKILTELIEAFTANDYVLIGDLLEYEVSPRLEALLAVLESVLKENKR